MTTTNLFTNQKQTTMSRRNYKPEQKVEVKETRAETLNRLYKENNLTAEDVYKDSRGFAIITRTGIDKIVSKQNITVAYEPVIMEKDWVVRSFL
jgi:hypothetical protein